MSNMIPAGPKEVLLNNMPCFDVGGRLMRFCCKLRLMGTGDDVIPMAVLERIVEENTRRVSAAVQNSVQVACSQVYSKHIRRL